MHYLLSVLVGLPATVLVIEAAIPSSAAARRSLVGRSYRHPPAGQSMTMSSDDMFLSGWPGAAFHRSSAIGATRGFAQR